MSPEFEHDQGFLFREDFELLAEWRALCEKREQRRQYEIARKEAWYNGRPFPEDRKKWYAFTNDCPHSVKEKERVRAEYREWYYEHAEWRLHATESLRARQLGQQVGKRDPILRVYAKARVEEVIPCYWCKRPTIPGDREIDHIVPLTRGGHHTARNLAITCRNCNQAKKDQMPADFMRSIRLVRAENTSRARHGLQNQFPLAFAQLPPIKRREPRRATQLTLLKLRA